MREEFFLHIKSPFQQVSAYNFVIYMQILAILYAISLATVYSDLTRLAKFTII